MRQFVVGMLLVSAIPALTALHLLGGRPWPPGVTWSSTHGLVLLLGLVAAPVLGAVLLARYPLLVTRLRRCLDGVARGDLPGRVELDPSETDTADLEDALNIILERLRSQLEHATTRNQLLQEEIIRSSRVRAIGTLAAGIAHELNTPLQIVRSNAEVEKAVAGECVGVVRQALDAGHPSDIPAILERWSADAADIRSGTQQAIFRMAAIIRAMQSFGDKGGVKTPTDLNATIREVVTITRYEWKHVAPPELQLDENLPFVPCLAGELRQGLTTLILNAVRAIAALPDAAPASASARLRISTFCRDDMALIQVQDHGIGIPAHLHERVFDPFFTTQDPACGSGLNLALLHASIVDRHGGSVHFRSEVGVGTTFTIELPLAPTR